MRVPQNVKFQQDGNDAVSCMKNSFCDTLNIISIALYYFSRQKPGRPHSIPVSSDRHGG